ncbi:flavin-containing monooxygenase [Novosphingobium sp. JCM 18896]|uniref:flavin-containing monooxygenase n=1 Tax=Novosphingobium sp. JCM 18896 TaxID=2989731 RepID=UPI0022223C84|nr:NAD(P)/FAD-dependent oxidoreductase [Novosphingobium sp. JCM 18896]MCW1428716.1 NAD(P)/FAD-dependent oxidoreductase [Novosphingobium sp. JCM 18896]
MTSNPDSHAFQDLVASPPEVLEAHLAALDPVPLLLVYTHLSGDESLLEEFRPHIKGAWSFEAEVPEDLQAELRSKITATFHDYARNRRPLPPAPDAGMLQRMCDVAVGQEVPPEYLPMVLEELNFGTGDAKSVAWRKPVPPVVMDGYHVLVIGAGYSGLAMAIKLKEAGIPFTVIEKNDDVGGTWYENSYPGVAVDTPNHFYSYSFRTSSDWDHYFAQGPEIIEYIRTVYREADLADHMRFEQEVVRAAWNEADQRWAVTIRDKDGSEYEMKVNALISGTGLLNRPSIPDIPGLDDFQGPKFHSSRWDHSIDLTGKTVVQIGTGASGMQLGPKVAEIAKHLTIFQRSPHWARHNPLLYAKVSDGLKWGLEHVPFYTKWWRFQLLYATSDGMLPHLRKDPNWPEPETSLNAFNKAIREQLIAHMREQLKGDEELLAKVTPSFPPYGKRMLRDSNWFSALTRDNVELVTGSVKQVTATGVVDKDGVEHPAEVLILATGFKAQAPLYPMEIVGTDGSLRDKWGDDDPRAHLGITVPGFPNLFILYGPGTNGGHGGSAVFNSECQVRYTMLALRELIEREASSLEVRREPFEAYQAEFDAEHEKLVWTHPGVNNWYKNKAGRVVTNNPWRLSRYRNMTATFDTDEYEIKTGAEA